MWNFIWVKPLQPFPRTQKWRAISTALPQALAPKPNNTSVIASFCATGGKFQARSGNTWVTQCPSSRWGSIAWPSSRRLPFLEHACTSRIEGSLPRRFLGPQVLRGGLCKDLVTLRVRTNFIAPAECVLSIGLWSLCLTEMRSKKVASVSYICRAVLLMIIQLSVLWLNTLICSSMAAMGSVLAPYRWHRVSWLPRWLRARMLTSINLSSLRDIWYENKICIV